MSSLGVSIAQPFRSLFATGQCVGKRVEAPSAVFHANIYLPAIEVRPPRSAGVCVMCDAPTESSVVTLSGC